MWADLPNKLWQFVALEPVGVLALGRNVSRVASIAEQDHHAVNVVDVDSDCSGFGVAGEQRQAHEFGPLGYQSGYDVRLTHGHVLQLGSCTRIEQ